MKLKQCILSRNSNSTCRQILAHVNYDKILQHKCNLENTMLSGKILKKVYSIPFCRVRSSKSKDILRIRMYKNPYMCYSPYYKEKQGNEQSRNLGQWILLGLWQKGMVGSFEDTNKVIFVQWGNGFTGIPFIM